MQLSNLQATGSLQALPSGPEGVRETLRVMQRLTRAFKKDMSIRLKALSLVSYLPPKAWADEIRALHQYVRDDIRYIKDVRGVETLATPVKTLEFEQGDCDDKAVLLASLLESIGHPTRFVAIGFQPNNFRHVYVESKLGHTWISAETTEPVDIGWKPNGVRAEMIVHN